MKINKYSTKLNRDKALSLVKEESIDYSKIESLTSPENIYKLFKDIYKLHEKAEEFAYLLCLDGKLRNANVFEVSHGSINTSLLEPFEVFKRAMLCNSKYIFLVHNHPSGDTSPSRADIEITKKILEGGKILGVALLDHIIIGDNFYSLCQENVINFD